MALGALDIIIAADTAAMRKSMDDAVGIIKSSTQKMEAFAKTAGGVIAGALAFTALEGSIKRTLDFADSLSKMSQKVGVSVDALYALQAAGKLSDVSLETLQSSLLKFNKGLGTAEMGTGDTANALQNLGISLKDSAGHLKTSDQYLFEVADKFQNMPNGIAKSTLAMQLFGKSGAEMIPLLNSGSEALREYTGILDTESAQAAEKFNDSLTTINLAAERVATQFMVALSPTLSAIADDFTNVSKEGKDTGKTLGEDLAQGMRVAINLGYIVAGSFTMAGHALGNLGAAASLLAEGDFAGAKFAWNKISEDAKKDQAYWDERIKSIMSAKQTVDDLAKSGGGNTFDLEDFKAGDAKAKAEAKARAAEQKKLIEDIAKAKRDAMDDNAAREAEAELGVYRAKEQAIEDSYAFQAQEAIDAYNDELDLIERNANALASAYDRSIALITPEVDKLNAKMLEDWQALYDNGLFDDDQMQKFYTEWQKKAEDSMKGIKDDSIQLSTVFEDAFKTMEDSMVNMFMTGKFRAQDFFNAVIEGIIRMQIRNSITAPLTQAIGGINFGALFSGTSTASVGSEFGVIDGVSYGGFAVGGYTGSGGVNDVAGVVHGGEYVIPAWMVNKSPALIGSLEATRTKGYADGGMVGGSVGGVTINVENRSGTPVSADNVSTSFDAKGMVVNVVIDAINRNAGGMRDTIRGVR